MWAHPLLFALVASLSGWGVGSIEPEPTPPRVQDALSPDARDARDDLRSLKGDLAVNVGELHAGLWAFDHAAVGKASTAIAGHPHVGSAERERLQGILGQNMAHFAQADRRVHDTAVRLAEAASKQDPDLVSSELSERQVGCVACHTPFRDRLRS